jgi:hypothetical protein
MHLKVFLKLKKPQNPLFWAKNPKKTKKTKNPKKTKKTQKNPLGWVFFKNPGFFQPWGRYVMNAGLRIRIDLKRIRIRILIQHFF